MFTSGYFLNLKKKTSTFILSKTQTLLLPLYGWNIFYGLFCQILNKKLSFNLDTPFTLYNIFIAPITDGHQFLFNLASWFIIPLFILQTLTHFLLSHNYQNSFNFSKTIIIFFITIITLSSLTLSITPAPLNKDFSLTILRSIYFYPSFAFGLLYKYVLEKKDTLPNIYYFPTIILLLSIIYLIYPNYLHTPSWLHDINEPPFILFIISFLSILFWLRISKILSPIIKQSKTLNLISQKTFAIMMHHFIGFFFIKSILSFTFKDFNHLAFHTNIWYTYFLFNEEIITPLYLIITLVITLLIDFTKQRFYDTINHSIKHFYTKLQKMR